MLADMPREQFALQPMPEFKHAKKTRSKATDTDRKDVCAVDVANTGSVVTRLTWVKQGLCAEYKPEAKKCQLGAIATGMFSSGEVKETQEVICSCYSLCACMRRRVCVRMRAIACARLCMRARMRANMHVRIELTF